MSTLLANLYSQMYFEIRERGMIFNFLIVQVHFFLLIEFHCTFSIYYKILINYTYYYFILIRMV